MCNRRVSTAAAIVLALLAVPAVAQAQPFIQSAVPSESSQTITIRGFNFGAVAPDVYLNLTALAVQSFSPTQIVAALPSPALAPATYSLIIMAGGQFALAEVALGGVGSLTAPPLGTATATGGFQSMGLTMAASAFNSLTATAERQTFRWRVDPVSNNTVNPTGRLQLLFGTGAATPVATGLFIAETGLINFAAGQTFPGVLTSVVAGAGVTVNSAPGVAEVGVAPNGITTGLIADNTIQVFDLGFDVATQAELNAHTRKRRLVYTAPVADTTPTTTFSSLLTVGTFTKAREGSDIQLLWNGSVHKSDFPFASNFCEYQLRIDGDHDGAHAIFGGAGRARALLDDLPVSVSALFEGLAAGSHTVSIWSRGDADVCGINAFAGSETVIVTETGG